MTEINWNDQPLGELTDAAIAAQLGLRPGQAANARRGLGVPGFKALGAPTRVSRGEINWNAQPLGEQPDAVLAARLGAPRGWVRSARARRGIPLFVSREDRLTSAGPERDARWYTHPVTAEGCRYCLESVKLGSLRARDRVTRWTDQRPCCAEHYGALPACAKCPAPVSDTGDLCDECITIAIRAECEAGCWRCAAPQITSAVGRGDIEHVRRGLAAFERRKETRGNRATKGDNR